MLRPPSTCRASRQGLVCGTVARPWGCVAIRPDGELIGFAWDEPELASSRTVDDRDCDACGGTPQSVQVIFRDVAKDDWAVAGILASEPRPAEPSGGTRKSE